MPRTKRTPSIRPGSFSHPPTPRLPNPHHADVHPRRRRIRQDRAGRPVRAGNQPAELGALALASWGTSALVTLGPADIPRLAEVSVDGRVLAATLALSFLTAMVFGLAPAIQGAAADPAEALRAGGSLRDVAPTVLRLLGLEPPVEMTGRDLREC